jgi:predicted porin
MQKKLIALAVASLASGAAFAQTNVTMYGIADAGYVWSQGDALVTGTNKFSGIQSGLLSGSRLGFKGEEALGNGLKAIFTLEYGAEHRQQLRRRATGGSLNARQQFVGLAGGFGTVALGRQYSPGLPGHGQQ